MPKNQNESNPMARVIDRRVSDLIKSVEEVQRKADAHDEIRGTLLVNFNEERGKRYGLVLDKNESTISLLLRTLEHFIDKRKPERLCLISDGDGHWFTAPADKREGANKYFEQLGTFWDADEAARDGMDYPKEPDWLRPINGPHTLSFTNPQES